MKQAINEAVEEAGDAADAEVTDVPGYVADDGEAADDQPHPNDNALAGLELQRLNADFMEKIAAHSQNGSTPYKRLVGTLATGVAARLRAEIRNGELRLLVDFLSKITGGQEVEALEALIRDMLGAMNAAVASAQADGDGGDEPAPGETTAEAQGFATGSFN